MPFLHHCIESIKATTPESPIFVVNDGSTDGTKDYLNDRDDLEAVLHISNQGITPSIDTGIRTIHNWVRFKQSEGVIKDTDIWISYVQDDVEFIVKGWPAILAEFTYSSTSFNPGGAIKGIGFLTGHDAPEHQNSRLFSTHIGDPFKGTDIHGEFRNHIRATHMMAKMDFWLDQLPFDVKDERGNPRGHPGGKGLEARGSDCDWWCLRGHPKSALGRGYINLVVPGILKHSGYKDSTWQSKELPEINE